MKKLSLCVLVLVGGACRGSGGNAIDGGRSDSTGRTTIYDIQMGVVPVDTAVNLTSVVITAIDRYGNALGNVYVSEPQGGAYSGIVVYGAQVAGGTLDNLSVGDLVDVTGGVVSEFALAQDMTGRTLTEIAPPQAGTVLITRTGAGTVPAPTVVDPVAMAADDAEAEKWEGVLVKMVDVAAVSNPYNVTMTDPTLMEMSVTGPFRVSSSLVPLEVNAIPVVSGDCFAEIVGIGDYFFTYKLLPRSAADFVTGTNCLPPENTLAMCQNTMDDDHDGFTDCLDRDCWALTECIQDTTITAVQIGTVPTGSRVHITGAVITAITSDSAWVQEEGVDPQGRYRGVYVYRPTVTTGVFADLALGDVLDIVATADEYFGVTELTGGTVTETGTGTVPDPIVVDPSTLADLVNGEPYEGVLVQVQNVHVVSINPDTPNDYGDWSVGDAATPLRIDNIMLPRPAIVLDQCFASITGVHHYSFNTFKIEPRGDADLVTGNQCP